MAVYWVALAVAVAAVALVYLLLRSRRGLALTAIRDTEVASESLGVDNFRTKLLVYVAAAFGTGLVGALIYPAKTADLARCRLQRQDWTADSHLHRGDRRHRHASRGRSSASWYSSSCASCWPTMEAGI